MDNNETQTIEKGFDLATRELKDTIAYCINNSNLPPVIIKYVLSDLLREAEGLEAQMIETQNKEYIERIKERNEKVQEKQTDGEEKDKEDATEKNK